MRSRTFPELCRQLWILLRGSRTRLAFVTVALSASSALRLAYPASPKLAIDYVLTDHPGPRGIPGWLGLPTDGARLLLLLGAVVATLEIVAVALDLWGQFHFKALAWEMQIRFSRRIFERALELPIVRLQSLKGGGLTSVLREDARSPADLLYQLVVGMWRSGLQLAGGLVVLASVDPLLLVGACALLPSIWLSHLGFTGRIRPIFRAARRAREDADAWVAEAVGGVRTIRAFRRERTAVRRYVAQYHVMLRHILRGSCASMAVEAAWRIVLPTASACVLVYGGRRVLSGRLTLGDLTLFLGYMGLLLNPLQQLVSGAMRLQDDLAGFGRALDLVNEEADPELGRGPKAGPPVAVRGHVRFEHVAYRYPDDGRPVLLDLDFELRPGETVALVGARGAGKTTTVNLLSRFFAPTQGRILLDGFDVRTLPVERYREIVGLVDQDALLFDVSVRDNIAFGARDLGDEEIRNAAARANALSFIEQLPQGFDTPVGERGARLSAGQRQCIALARALLRKPRILILDEATNHLDGESEASILSSIQALGNECTRIIVGHRLSTIRAADRVLMLEGGRIVFAGSHEKLLREGGRYAEFLGTQLEAAAARAAGT